MTHDELVSGLAELLDRDSQQVEEVLDALNDVIIEKLTENKAVALDGLGILTTRKQAEYISVEPDTQRRYLVPPKIETLFIPVADRTGWPADRPDVEKIATMPALVQTTAEILHLEAPQAELFLKTVFDKMHVALAENRTATIDGLGTFRQAATADRVNAGAQNTGTIDDAMAVKIEFIPGERVSEQVNRPFSHFEMVLLNEGVVLEGVAEVVKREISEEKAATAKPEEATTVGDIGWKPEPVMAMELQPDPTVASGPETDENLAEATGSIEASGEPVPDELPSLAAVENTVVTATIGKEPPPREASADKRPLRRVKRPARHSPVWIPVLGGIAIAVATLFFFMQWQIGGEAVSGTADAVVHSPTRGRIVAAEEGPGQTAAFARKPPGPANHGVRGIPVHNLGRQPEMVVVPDGKTLRLLAEDRYGSREYWVCIYLKNKDKINNPNLVPAGTELILPDISEYGFDVADPQSIAKAKALGNSQLSAFRR